ncbi:BolA family transcriptional regulator [Microcoleus sp. A2-C5]|jgi:stress-induced morphogen|uniref:BolA family protein n=1 Tax=Microcoleaceae TaxID=1892252 RepID=UPI002237A14B|nr:BolA family transcriptional regulator [Lyngbya sp. CCAP 1446/10]MCW6048515.1 BolA family transcriptional regulator [Lyngbya sp. CCAP 1446/10]
MVTPSQVAEMIQTGLPDAKLKIDDLNGGGDHYQVRVVSAAFEGKSRVQQHQLVYGALKQAMASEAIHALALETLTPAEWAAKSPVA